VQKGSLRRFLRFLQKSSRIFTGKITFCVHRKKGRLLPQKKVFFSQNKGCFVPQKNKGAAPGVKFTSPMYILKKATRFD